MAGEVTISLATIFSVIGFFFQVGLTVAAVAFSHGAIKTRVASIEEKIQDHSELSRAVAKLETEVEGIGREIKNLRDDFRHIMDELSRASSRGHARQ